RSQMQDLLRGFQWLSLGQSGIVGLTTIGWQLPGRPAVPASQTHRPRTMWLSLGQSGPVGTGVTMIGGLPVITGRQLPGVPRVPLSQTHLPRTIWLSSGQSGPVGTGVITTGGSLVRGGAQRRPFQRVPSGQQPVGLASDLGARCRTGQSGGGTETAGTWLQLGFGRVAVAVAESGPVGFCGDPGTGWRIVAVFFTSQIRPLAG